MADKHPLEACKPEPMDDVWKKYPPINLKRRPRIGNDNRRRYYRRSRVSLRQREGVENVAYDDEDEKGDIERNCAVAKPKSIENHCTISRRCLNFEDLSSNPISSQSDIAQSIEGTSSTTNFNFPSVFLDDRFQDQQNLSVSSRSQSLNEKGCKNCPTPKRFPTFHQSSRKSSRHSRVAPKCTKSKSNSIKESQDMKQDGFPSHFLRSKIRFVKDDHVLEAFSEPGVSAATDVTSQNNRQEQRHQNENVEMDTTNCDVTSHRSAQQSRVSEEGNEQVTTVQVPVTQINNSQLNRLANDEGHATPNQHQGTSSQTTVQHIREEPTSTGHSSQIQEYLPDILNAHALPSYSTLPGVLKNATPRNGAGELSSHLPRQSLLRSQVIASTETLHRLSQLEYDHCPTIFQPNDCGNSVVAPSNPQPRPDDDPKHCCGSARAQSISFRWFIVMIAFAGLSCAIVGTVLGVLKASGREHLTVALLMISVGIALIVVSGIAWKLTSQNAPSCPMMLGLHTEERVPRRRFRPRASHGRSNHPFAAMMYPEFQYRPPPPSYQASMQDYRLQAFLCDRLRTASRIPRPSISPPPTYRSNCGSDIIVRPPIPLPKEGTLEQPPNYSPRPSQLCNANANVDCEANFEQMHSSIPGSNSSSVDHHEVQLHYATMSTDQLPNCRPPNIGAVSTVVEIEENRFGATCITVDAVKGRDLSKDESNNEMHVQRQPRVAVEILAHV